MPARSTRRTRRSPTHGRGSSTAAAASRRRSGWCRASRFTRSRSGPTSSTSSTAASTATRSRKGCGSRVNERARLLLSIADDELIVGWRDSEWTGIAPTLEEDVAFSSIAQNEIGHARALYELAAADLGTIADALAFDRSPDEYRCAPLVELRLVPDWARTIARRVLYEAADELWLEALRGEPRFREAMDELWPYALALVPEAEQTRLADRFGREVGEAVERGSHTDELAPLWDEM